MWGRAPPPVQAVRRTAGFAFPLPLNQFAKIDLDSEELSCPAASPRANPPRLDAKKVPVKLASKKPDVLRTPRTGEGARPHMVRGTASARGKIQSHRS